MFHTVGPSGDLTLALLPQENSIFGVVTETYDLLRSSELGESKWIRGAVALSVQHCLVVRRGKTIRDIKRVLSHEQVRNLFIFWFVRWFVLNLTPLGRRVASRNPPTGRPWDSADSSLLRTCPRHSWLKSLRRLQPQQPSRRGRMMMLPTAQRFAPRSACKSSVI